MSFKEQTQFLQAFSNMGEAINIKVLSLNVRGLVDNVKRRCVFDWMRNSRFEMFFLQETHSTKECEKIWASEWGYKIFFCHGKSNSAGICILLKPTSGITVHSVHRVEGGRILLLNISYDNAKLTVVNVYGPNKDDLVVFEKLHSLIQQFGEEPYIVGGDINTVQNPYMDRYPNHDHQNHPNCSGRIETLKEDLDLIDVWRYMNPCKRQFTWRSKTAQSRIDYFLISNTLKNFVDDVGIHYGYRSDHSAISLSIKRWVPKRGPGFWKLNTSLLSNPSYKSDIRQTIQSVIQENRDMEVDKLWEFLKYKVKEKFIFISSNRKKEIKIRCDALSKDIEHIQTLLTDNPGDNYLNEQLVCKEAELQRVHEEHVRGIMIRTRATWISEGEKNSRYFLNLEKRNFDKKHIQKLRKGDLIITEPRDILLEEKQFYETLYTSNDIDDNDIERVMNDLNIKPVDQDVAMLCEGCISEKECYDAIMSMDCDKTPGTDGLPVNFYRIFWEDIKEVLCAVFNTCFEKGELCPSMKRGIITLLPKKDKDTLYLKNWRPISLLNTDYKIVAKILATRLQKVLPFIIHGDQTGFLRNRYIGENIRLFLDSIDFCKKYSIKGIVFSIDFEKAFDCVEWNFLDICLSKFGFGDTFKSFVKMMYTNIESCVINNGFSSSVFNLQRGVRQGCPLSPYLFLIGAEILGIMIRQSTLIKGIEFNGNEIRLSQYADDTLIYLDANERTLSNCFDILYTYSSISGLKINVSKSKIVRLGNFQNTLCPRFEVEWVDHIISYLGVQIPVNDLTDIHLLNFDVKMKEARGLLKVWSCRNLTLLGKITVLKSLVLPKFVYLFSNLPDPPSSCLNSLQKMFFEFLWSGKTDRIKRSILFNEYEHGGLKMTHIKSFCAALKITWVKRILDNQNEGLWKLFFQVQMNPYGNDFVFSGNFQAVDIVHFNLSPFWQDVLLAWASYKYYNPVKFKDVVSQSIWNNTFIKIGGKMIFFGSWFDLGIKYIKDIMRENGNLKSFSEMVIEFNLNSNQFMRYFAIVCAITAKWKTLLREREAFPFSVDEKLQVFLTKKKPTKFCYSVFVNKVCLNVKETSQLNKWECDLNMSLEMLIQWQDRFKRIFKTTLDTKIRTFQFKFIHRRIATNEFLCRIGVKSSPMCNFCNQESQDLLHLFCHCPVVKKFWNEVNTWLCELDVLVFPLSMIDICFGVQSRNDFVNSIIFYAKYFIYRCKHSDKIISFRLFQKEISFLEKVEYIIALRQGKLLIHLEKWKVLM